jgi:NTE family protein
LTYPPDVVLVIPRNACETLEFDRADEMIALGYKAASKKMEFWKSHRTG